MLELALSWKWPGSQFVVRGDTLERWDGPGAEPTADEITAAVADYTANYQPKEVLTRDIIRRMTPVEVKWFALNTDGSVLQLWHTMLSGVSTNVNGAEFKQGWAYVKSVGVPTPWADAATADARQAAICG